MLFRLGTASNLAVFTVDVALITALYVVLKPVNSRLALLAAAIYTKHFFTFQNV
jgi:hypothetical protein